MVFLACGLNHTTAPLPVREQMALSLPQQEELLYQLVSLSDVKEAAILSTCNRTEIYCETDDPKALIPWLLQNETLNAPLLPSYFYQHQEYQGIRHTLRVASGLDSMMIGESQIRGQMKQAYQQACMAGTAKSILHNVFKYIFNASKRIRNDSGIGNNPVSIAYAAAQLVSQLFKNHDSLQVFLIGSGETATLAAKYLHKQGLHQFRIAGRSMENAEKLAAAFQGEAVPISDIEQYISEADVIISATACPLPFINQAMVKNALKKRHYAPMFFLDLAVPRDIEPDVADLANVHLYNIDHLQSITDQGMQERHLAARHAERLIEVELDNYIRQHRSRGAVDVICDYRRHMHSLAEKELLRAQIKLSTGSDQLKVMGELCSRLVNKLTHYPTIGLKQAAEEGRDDLFDAANYLFKLSQEEALDETSV